MTEVHLMLERVARAIALQNGYTGNAKTPSGYLWWRHYLPDARAAVMAMREVTVDVADAGRDAIWQPDLSINLAETQWCWEAMIDTILGGEK